MKTSIIATSALAACVAAAPSVKRQAPKITDATILNYALTLEHLEDKFYREGLANFTESDFTDAGFDASVRKQLETTSMDETTHVSFITAALKEAGAPATAECTYAFGVSDVKTFLATASILEGVGVSAYLGAAADIMSKTYLTAAGSILTVESRHSAYIRDTLKQAPFPSPFDSPLDYDEVYTLASAFIKSCPDSNPKLPVKAFPTLMLSPDAPKQIKTGTEITLMTPDSIVKAGDGGKVYGAFITVTGPVFAEATEVTGGYKLTVPMTKEGTAPINGQSYVVLTGCNEAVTDDTIAAGPAVVEVTN